VFVYSGDTEPCKQVIELADKATILVHEAAGAAWGHSDALQAGQTAQSAGARNLYLIHYANGKYKDDGLLDRAAQKFTGPVHLAEDFMQFEF
jgi:ribonuclease Z